jgi:indolepyruvate ferredoxin oxidoreductase, alpha subunit
LDTIHVMGSGIGLAQGQAMAQYEAGRVLAVCGDSTFFHAVMPSLVNAVYNKANVTLLLLDNRWTSMTGHQPNPRTGEDGLGNQTVPFDFVAILKAMGVEFVRAVDAYDLAAGNAAIREALDFPRASVVVLQGECMLQRVRRFKIKSGHTRVDQGKCNGCRTCVTIGCPAVAFDLAEKKASIDSLLCTDCGLCTQVCNRGCIGQEGAKNGI